jgi:hypothetical protein
MPTISEALLPSLRIRKIDFPFQRSFGALVQCFGAEFGTQMTHRAPSKCSFLNSSFF